MGGREAEHWLRSAGDSQRHRQGRSQRFLVDNSLLRSDSTGLRYRTCDGDKIRDQKPVAWGKCVWGVLNEAGTRLAVGKGGRRFLPVTVKGLTVLKQVDEGEQFEDEEDDWKEPLRALANPCTGPGSSYEIIAEKVAVKSVPSFNAANLAWLARGEAVELFSWDDSWKWRLCLERRRRVVGWLLLCSERKDLAARPTPTRPWRPEPLCDAAAEGRLCDLRRYLAQCDGAAPRDVEGRTPLQLSVLRRQLPCAVRLLEAGADAAEVLLDSERRGEALDELCAALLTAFAERPLNEEAQGHLRLALKSLDPAERSVARTELARRGVEGYVHVDLFVSADGDCHSASAASTQSTPQDEEASVACEASCVEVSDDSPKKRITVEKRRSKRFALGRVGSRASSSSDSEAEVKSGEAFRTWLEDRPSMQRLSTVGCETGNAWDFPLTKSEKRELLLMYVTEGEKLAEESAWQALSEERRSRKSLESAKAALARLRKCRRSKGRRSLGGVS